jgi:hypothetical protein
MPPLKILNQIGVGQSFEQAQWQTASVETRNFEVTIGEISPLEQLP